ncbi:Hpt domain-containing protein [Amphibiibacter pelophylacis]|uniref:Hpt domain-containing protein n=1 Tax=Amphibiibacter pelophylacis TaxID=1799477 RepID=A0ACC6P430_9BURK
MPLSRIDDVLTRRLPAACQRVFDVARLREVARLDPQPGGSEFLPLVLDTFGSSLTQHQGHVQAAQRDRNGQQLCQIVHTLKTSALGVGALRLGDCAARLDASLKALSCSAASVVQLQALVVELLQEVDFALKAVSALVHELKGQDELGHGTVSRPGGLRRRAG